MSARRNVLVIVIDQLRADCVSGALARHVRLPNIRALAGEGVNFRNHFTVVTPCGPSRVSMLTGQYAMNHRSVRNGTPLRHDTPTLGTESAKAGYEALLFGYTDTPQDPRVLDPDDPRLFSYEELARGFTEVVRFRQESDASAWEGDLAAKGYQVPPYPDTYRPNGPRPDDPAFYAAEDSDTAYLTDRAIADLGERPPGWFALVTYIRPHPPFVAPEPYNRMYDPAEIPSARAGGDGHPYLAPARAQTTIAGTIVGFPEFESTDENTRLMRALYFGLATEVDDNIGRILTWLKDTGRWDETLVVLTADHGDMLGDYGLWGKRTYHDAAFHVPLIIRDPERPERRGTEVTAPTESVDLAPTLLERMGAEVPHSMDGRSLLPFLEGPAPDDWRGHSFSEIDFGDPLAPTLLQRELGLALDAANLAVLRTEKHRLVQFAGDLPPVLFDMEADGETRNLAPDPDHVRILLDLSRRMLCHRMQNPDGTFSRTMVTSEGVKVGAG